MICSCGSGLDYADCCQAYHLGAAVPTAEKLMRSRYAAYIVGDIDYLLNTIHPNERHADLEQGYRNTFESVQWVGLEVLSVFQGGEGDKKGKVEFKATYIQNGQRAIHYEKSRFKRHAGKWCYLDGVITDEVIG